VKSDLDYPLLDDQITRLKSGIIESYHQIHQELKLRSQIDITFSGTTAISVLIRGRQLFCMNCGDSRAILGRVTRTGWTSVALSNDHKPDLAEEKQRILSKNGRVDSYRDSNGKALGPARVWLNDEDIPGLAMSRSIGDEIATRAGVICTPEVFSHRLDTNDKFLILASDGIWEFISSEECVKIVSNYYFSGKFQEACEQLVSLSTHRWNKEDGNVDDITVIIAALKVKDE
jgi:serine/threonine protein phosphatase PrpC